MIDSLVTRLLRQEEKETRKPQGKIELCCLWVEEKPVSQLISEKTDCFHSSPIAPSDEAETSVTSFQPTLSSLNVLIAPKSRVASWLNRERRRGSSASISTPIEGNGVSEEREREAKSLTCTIM